MAPVRRDVKILELALVVQLTQFGFEDSHRLAQ
jgi:hypothetical protein